MKLSCDDSRSLVPGYLDGELTEEQAAPLRAHLFDCPGCREVAKQGKTLARWFAPGVLDVAVPEGFAVRVARRALAGDPGLPDQLQPASLAGSRSRGRSGSLLPFLLTASAVAASLLFALAVALQSQTLPAENGLDASTPPDWALVQQAPAELPDGDRAEDEEADEGR